MRSLFLNSLTKSLILHLPDDLKISTVKNMTASIPLTCWISKSVNPISIGIKIGRVNNTFQEVSFASDVFVASLKCVHCNFHFIQDSLFKYLKVPTFPLKQQLNSET